MIKILKADYINADGPFSDLSIGEKPETFTESDLVKVHDVTSIFLSDEELRKSLEQCAFVDLIYEKLFEESVEFSPDRYPEPATAVMEYRLVRRCMILAKELYPETEFVGGIIADWSDEEWEENQCGEAMLSKERAWELFDLKAKADEFLSPLYEFLTRFKNIAP